MARTVTTIKATMTDAFMNSSIMATIYGFTHGDSFDSTFSKVSFESILFYTIAVCANFVESLFDSHKSEVQTIISEQKPHSKNWYKNKALAYMHGYELLEDSDQFNTTGLTDAQIAASKVVKYAAVVEKANVVYIKVAGVGLQPLTTAQEDGLTAYFKEVKDAGVKLQIINRNADYFKASLVIYYDPIVLNTNGINAVTGLESVRDAVSAFIGSLPFNGEYRNNALIDTLQVLDGVVMAELVSAQTSNDGLSFTDVDAYVTPDSGYMKIYQPTDLQITYNVYETVGD
jgi:hypothetical protein